MSSQSMIERLRENITSVYMGNAAAVDRSRKRPRARLTGLQGLARLLPVTLQVNAIPVTGSSASLLRVPVTVPEGAVLELGYGLRDESIGDREIPQR